MRHSRLKPGILTSLFVAGLLQSATVGHPASSAARAEQSGSVGEASSPTGAGSAHPLVEHFDRLVPAALEATGVPGAAVGLITGGELAALRAYGFADIESRRPVTAETVFNVGSISKVAAAWAAMRLVADGRLELDRPVGTYVDDWPPGDSEFDERKVTLRRLLSHTAGLSLGAVPEYGPDDRVPSVAEALRDPEDGVRMSSDPGTEWSYSGGGYMLVQHLIEKVTGRSFESYVRETVFEPLGMKASAFHWTPELRADAATPYDGGEPVPYFRYAGQAAASLNSTAADLARFAAAGLDAEGAGLLRGRGVLPPEAIDLMQTPAPATEQQWGVRSGFGYQIWGLHDRWAVDDEHPRMAGHAGQNTGWSATLWVVPETGDGLVVLTNASDGREFWKWVLCDWARRINGTTYLGLCTDRPKELPAPPVERGTRYAVVDSLVEARIGAATGTPDAPGAVVFVAHEGRVIHRASTGLADLSTGRPLGTDDAFYLASLAKPFTSLAVTMLSAQGELGLDDSVREYLPELPHWADPVTITDLLDHTSGVPDYYPCIDWASVERFTNDDVIETVARMPEPAFEPGTRFGYSNSNYVLLSELVQRVSGASLGSFLSTRVLEPLGMESTVVYETEGQDLPRRAVGYAQREDGTFRVSDYLSVELTDGRTVPFRFTTTGGGGVFSTVDDLSAWTQALFGGRLLPEASLAEVLGRRRVPLDESDALGLADCAYGNGWYICDRYGKKIYWHDGNWGGFSTMLLHAPGHDLTVIVLSNLAGGSSASLGLQIAERLLSANRQELPPFVAGDLTFRGDSWPVELTTVEDRGPGREVLLTLPDLVYADEPVETRSAAGAIVVTFPFGLGDYALEPEGDSVYVARSTLGGDTAVLRLRPAEPPAVRRPVKFGNEDVSLAGTLYLPASQEPHPAVVVVQGSGEMGRSSWAYRSWGDAFARRGVAALVYDKRGAGESTGDFRSDSAFVGLTSDALAAAAYLRGLPEIDPGRVGLAGWSQGGWIQLRGAARDDSVTFLVMLSPAAFSPAAQEMQSLEARMRNAGFAETEIADALAYTRLYFYVAATGRGWKQLEAETARLPETEWAEHVQWPEAPEELSWWRRHLQVEPALDIPRIEAPVIAFFGGADRVVPAPANAGRLRELLAARPGSRHRVLTAPGADHRLELSAGPDESGQWRFPHVSPVVLEALERWLEERVLESRDR